MKRPRALTLLAASTCIALAIAVHAAAAGCPDFAVALRAPTDSISIAIVAGDFNADGKIDFAVANRKSDREGRPLPGNVSVLIGNGEGAFAGPSNYPIGISPQKIVAGDFNADGKSDLAVTNSGTDDVSVLLGVGDGTFGAAQTHVVGDSPRALAVADLNGDGRPDLIVGNDGPSNVSILFGNNSGTFDPAATIENVGGRPTSLAVADVNGDGQLDLVTGSLGIFGQNRVSVLLGQGGGAFAAPITSPSANYTAIAIDDLNGDSKADLVVVGSSVTIQLGNGDGTFQQLAEFGGSFGANLLASVAVADLNLDGKRDVVVANASGLGHVTTYFGNGDGTFAPGISYDSSGAAFVTLSEVNGDGILDIALATPSAVTILPGRGDGTFLSVKSISSGGNNTTAMVGADFDGDGRTDLAVATSCCGSVGVSILMGRGDATFDFRAVHPVGSFPRSIASGDFNRDGSADLAVANFSSDTVSILIGDGSGGFAVPAHFVTAAKPLFVAAHDLNGDGELDLAIAASGVVSILLGHGDGTFAPRADFPVRSDAPHKIAVGDLNGDRVPDLVVVLPLSLDLLFGMGDGTFSARVALSAEVPQSVAIEDFNRDGKLDLVISNGEGIGFDGYLAIRIGNGDGTFTLPVRYDALKNPRPLAVVDLNLDGISDVVAAHVNSQELSYFEGTGTGTLETPKHFAAGTAGTVEGPMGIVVADFNLDGRLDLAILMSKAVQILLNRSSCGAPQTPTISTISPNSGPAAGGTTITVSGSNFINGATVTIGGAHASDIVIVNSSTLTAVTPAGVAGAKNVVVTNFDATRASLTDGFTHDAVIAPTLDIDGNGVRDALTDGVLLLRYLFGFRGNVLVANAIGSGATRTTAAAVETYIASALATFDIDGNGSVDALTDGLLTLRYLFGFRGSTLVAGAVGGGATRNTSAAIEAYLAGL